jgi:hypothetical protein
MNDGEMRKEFFYWFYVSFGAFIHRQADFYAQKVDAAVAASKFIIESVAVCVRIENL